MAFKFNWTTFDDKFIDYAKDQLTEALNKGIKTEMIGNIKVKELYMGTMPPDLEVLEIGDLSEERFKGIFKITYKGDARFVFETTVQVNPLVVSNSNALKLGNGIVAANHPLVLPMQLKISDLKLRGIAALVLYSNKGITFCFKNDPLENIEVSSSFDNVPVIRKLLKKLIKTQISNFLLEDVPTLIHKYSLRKMKNENSTSIPNTNSTPSSNAFDSVPSSPILGAHAPEATQLNHGNTLESFGEQEKAWNRKWIGNDDLESETSLNQLFENGFILNRGLKCLKALNANKGILRLIYPWSNNNLCQSVNIDSWLISPPFSPVPIYIPRTSFYTTYTKDKHFSILDYLRRTAITKATYYGQNKHHLTTSNSFILANQLKQQQQQRHPLSQRLTPTATTTTTNDRRHPLWDNTTPERCDSETLFSDEMALPPLKYPDQSNDSTLSVPTLSQRTTPSSPSHSHSHLTTRSASPLLVAEEPKGMTSGSNSTFGTCRDNKSEGKNNNFNYIHTYHRGQRKVKSNLNGDETEKQKEEEEEKCIEAKESLKGKVVVEQQEKEEEEVKEKETGKNVKGEKVEMSKVNSSQPTNENLSDSNSLTLGTPALSSFTQRQSFNNLINKNTIELSIPKSVSPTSPSIQTTTPPTSPISSSSTSTSSLMETPYDTTHSNSNSSTTLTTTPTTTTTSPYLNYYQQRLKSHTRSQSLQSFPAHPSNPNFSMNSSWSAINPSDPMTNNNYTLPENNINFNPMNDPTNTTAINNLFLSPLNDSGNNRYVNSVPNPPNPYSMPLASSNSNFTYTNSTTKNGNSYSTMPSTTSLMYNNNLSSGYSSDGESTVCEEFPSEIVLEPSNNSMAAQLTNLMNSNQTISPYTRTLEHFAYRSFPHSKPLNLHKRRSFRQRRRLKIRVDGLMNSSTSSGHSNSQDFTGNVRKTLSPTPMDDLIQDLSELNF